MYSDIVERAREIAEQILPLLGYELFDLQYRRQGRHWVLKVVIDKEDGYIGIDDCELVSREIEKELDKEDFIPSSYMLEVSSPGLDRPLRNEKDYKRFVGKLAKFVFNEPVEGLSSVVGWIKSVGEDGTLEITLKDTKKSLKVNLDEIKRANLEVEF